jgi:hypothetical protein
MIALMIVAMVMSCVLAVFVGQLAATNLSNGRWFLFLLNVLSILMCCAAFGTAAKALLQ